MNRQSPTTPRRMVQRLLALASPLLFVGAALIAQPSGASSLTVTFTVTSVSFGSLTDGTSLQSQAVVTNTSSKTLYLKTEYTHGGDTTG